MIALLAKCLIHSFFDPSTSSGGITRLTESGLSMVTWKFLGEKMPSGEAEWIEEFEKYKAYPEYKM